MAHAVAVENRAGLANDSFERLASSLRAQPTIKHAIDWLAELDPPRLPGEMLTHDEFSHDILVAYEIDLYLSYDVS